MHYSILSAAACATACCLLCLPLCAPAQETPEDLVLSEGFEAEIPDLHTYHAEYAGDAARAHSGEASLRVSPTDTSGGAYFRLDGVVDLESDYEFSAWVYAAKTGVARLYISASDGKQRHTKAQVAGGKEGEWVRLVASLRGKEWRAGDCEVMLAMTTTGVSWFDDVTLRKVVLPDPPIEVYPGMVAALRAEADRTPARLAAAEELTLQPADGALVAGFSAPEPVRPGPEPLAIPHDGLMTFALDVPEAVYVTGSVRLTPDADLHPGLRAYVLCDDAVVGAPMVAAEAWQSEGNALTGPAPQVTGSRPPDEVELATWLLPAGRHYLTVAGPHFRPGGTLQSLTLRALPTAVEEPLYRFALLSDTHLSEGRATWMNVKMDGPSKEEFAATLALLQQEGLRFALLAGDMTDSARRGQFEALKEVLGGVQLPVYGCIGNHDSYLATSRADVLELCPQLFPGGATDYVFSEGPLRFIVLDGSHWRDKSGRFVDHYDAADCGGIGVRPEQVQWLEEELARDTRTPTVFVWHYPLVCRGGLSSCGYKLPASSTGRELLEVLQKAPNVVATLCGHTHWNEHNPREGIVHVVNPAFCEWPNAYRVFRVYQDRMEWELRQVSNRGFVRESFVPEKALSWMISTAADDLTGTIPLPPAAER